MKSPIAIQARYLVAAGLIAAATGPCWATNGYFAHGYSLKEKGVAGAGVAHPQDSLAAASNPAGMVLTGHRVDGGLSIFSPDRQYTASGGPAIPAFAGVLPGGIPGSGCTSPGTAPCQLPFSVGPQSINSGDDVFYIPNLGYNRMIGVDRSVGVSIYGNGGMNTHYEGGSATLFNPNANAIGSASGTFGAGRAGVDLSQLFVVPTYSQKIGGGNMSVGIGLVLAYQLFEAEGLANFAAFSLNPTKLSNNAHDSSFGVGGKLGILAEVKPGLRLGAAYNSEVFMDEFDDYAGLFAENGDFNIPQSYNLGLAWDTSPTTTFVLDFQQIFYSDIPAVGNPMSRLTDGSCLDALNNSLLLGGTGAAGNGCLGGSNGAGFGWDDVTVIKLGYEWTTGGNWTWRAGYSYTDQPVQESEVLFNILAPGVIEHHLTLGFTKALNPNADLNFSMFYGIGEDVEGQSPFDPTQTIKLEMDQFELAIGYSRRF